MYVTPARRHRRFRRSTRHLLPVSDPQLVAPDFVGWAGLGPIALLIENIIGIQADVPNRRIEWHLTRTDRHGINSLWLGEMGKVDLIASSRSARRDAVTITISTSDDEIADNSFELAVNRPECGKVTTLQVLLGQANQSFSVPGCAADDTARLVISDSAFTVTEESRQATFDFPIQIVDNHYSVAPGNEEVADTTFRNLQSPSLTAE